MVVIALSGLPGAGSSTVGMKLAKKLGLKFFSIGKYHKSFGHGASESERSMNAWEAKKTSLKEFEHEKDDLSRRIAEQGDVVIEGKLAVRFIKNADFKIWLKADFSIRAGRYAKRDNATLEDSRKMLKRKENAEMDTWMKVYGFDFTNQDKEADIVIDTSDISPDEVVGKIIEKMKRH